MKQYHHKYEPKPLSLVSGNYCKVEMDTVVIREYVVFRRRIPQPLSQPDSVTRSEPNGDHRTD